MHVPRGRVVGGPSITNGTIALRRLPEHYNEWDRHVDGFGWETWLPWFRAIERDLQYPEAPWHGDAGPIPTNRYLREEWFPLMERFAQAATGRGHATGRVLEHRRLSVIDAWVIPRIPSANTHLCVIALAERLAAQRRAAR